jgi:predicted nicotinamide N-methyase
MSNMAPKKPASVVAPAARSAGAKKVQLTATQVALANKLGISLQQYAAEVAKLEAQNG